MKLKYFFFVHLIMKNSFFYIFLSAAMVGNFFVESISSGCAMECCEIKENTCCPSKTKSHNCENNYGSCSEQYFQPKNISKLCHKNDLKKDLLFYNPSTVTLNRTKGNLLVSFSFNFLKKNTTTNTILIC